MVGIKGMGTLLYRPEIESTSQEMLQIELDSIAKETAIILQGASSLAIDALYEIGGSSGGARPKILFGTVARGAGALLAKGNFWQGAVRV